MGHDRDVAEPVIARPTAPSRNAGRDAGPVSLQARTASPASVLRLQRMAGNAAVQRAVAIDEMTTSVDAAPAAAAPATAGPAAAPGAGGNSLGDGTGPVSITGPMVNLHAPMVQADGVLQAGTIIADSVVASSYTPGAGNVW